MKCLAPGVWRLDQFPRPLINVYLAEDVLIDAGRSWDAGRIRKQLAGREISMLALTHVHADHQGSAKVVCEERGIPLACHEDDVEAMEGRRPVSATQHPLARTFARLWEGPPHKVDRVLREGDEVAGFRVIHTPGHALGEVIFWRESDRVAICGDVIRNITYVTMRARLAEPPADLTPDPVENRRSIRKLADLNPALILPGHGPAVTDMAAFERFVARLEG
ncbi:MAG TPA: MBL fold metallo-hydrolase [Solirubrobacterales bacterium]|jgi:glyoxylase-like metal-dependent hydrolase (beta-lactamase superfamily II)|nr:MBL fold metallo-hydrolase [Solirubrobacterales bacterium]